MSRELKHKRSQIITKERMRREIAAKHIEPLKDDFTQKIHIFMEGIDSKNRKDIKNVVVELMTSILVGSGKEQGIIEKYIDSIRPYFTTAFKDAPKNMELFFIYFTKNLTQTVREGLENNLQETEEIFKDVIKNSGWVRDFLLENTAIINLISRGTHNLPPEPERDKIEQSLKKLQNQLKGWAQAEDAKKSWWKQSWFLGNLSVRSMLIGPFVMLLPLSAYNIIEEPSWAAVCNELISLAGLTLISGSLLLLTNKVKKNLQNNIHRHIVSRLANTINIDWIEASPSTFFPFKVVLRQFAQPVVGNSSLGRPLSKSIRQRLKGKGASSLATVKDEIPASSARENKSLVQEKIAGLYLLDRAPGFFGNKRVYGYIPPQAGVPAECRPVFEEILKNGKIVTATGGQGIKFLANKKLIDPGSSIEYTTWELKRMDSHSAGDRLLGVSYPAQTKDGKECIIFIFNTYDKNGTAEMKNLALSLDAYLPAGFSPLKKKSAANNSVNHSSMPHSVADCTPADVKWN